MTNDLSSETIILTLMFGWTGKTVIIDLTDHKIKKTKSDITDLHTYIGGRVLALSYIAT